MLLVLENSDYDLVYCEQLEDILVKLKNDKFIGIQVKTREIGRGPFRFQDPEIMHSLERFVIHERDFPNQFLNYDICSSVGFLEKKDASDLGYCLKKLNEQKGSKSCYSEINFSERVNELSKAVECSEDLVLATLNKVRIIIWADLQHFEKVLASEIS